MWRGLLCALVVLKCGASYLGATGGNTTSSTGSGNLTFTTQTNASCIPQPNSDIPRRTAFAAKVTGPDETLIPTNKTFISSKDFIKTPDKRDPTYRITIPGTYVLQEDIVLDYREPDTLDHPFHFGFVMGIVISADNVRLDLNGKTIRMSDQFANHQRFFNIIELAQAPYPKGKAGFKDEIVPARNVIIENGIIARSSHGAIHGNDNDRVLIRDLTIKDFEVAAIAINNGRNMIIDRVVIDNIGLQVPVHSNFAITWMLNRTLTKISATADYSNATRAQANEYLADADLLDILQSPGSDKHRLTENKSGKPEGSMFGIYLSSKFNVGTLDRGVLSKYSQNVLIQNVQIRNVATGMYEMIGMSVDDNPMLDSFGNRVHWTFLYDKTGARLPLTTTLNRLKYKLAKMAVWSTSIAKPEKMPKIFVDAILDKDNLAPPAYESKIFPQAGTDSRAGHSPKGTFGIRLDGVQNVRMENCTIENIVNNDTPGSVIDKNKVVYPACPIVWRGKEGSKQVYKGNYAFGISLSSCVSVDVVRSKVANVRSENGNAFGMAFIGPTRGVSVSRVNITNTTVNSKAYKKVPPALPNLETKAMVWYKEEEATDIQFHEVTAKALHSSPQGACTGKATDSKLCPGAEGWSTEEPHCTDSSAHDSAEQKLALQSRIIRFLTAGLIVFGIIICLLVAFGFFYVRRKFSAPSPGTQNYKDAAEALSASIGAAEALSATQPSDDWKDKLTLADAKSVTSINRGGRAHIRPQTRSRRTGKFSNSGGRSDRGQAQTDMPLVEETPPLGVRDRASRKKVAFD